MSEAETISGVEAPGPTGRELTDALRRYQRDPLSESLRLFETYGDVAALRRGPFVTVFLFHPDHARHVLITKVDDYSRNTTPASQLKLSIGAGLVTADKPEWTRMKQLVQPAFTRKSLDDWVPMMNAVAARLATDWGGRSGATIDVHQEFGRSLLEIVGKMLLGECLSEEEARQVRLALTVAADLDQAMPRAALLQRSSRGASEEARRQFEDRFRPFTEAFERLHALLDRYIDERRRNPGKSDLLSTLIEARTESGDRFSDSEVRDQFKTLVAAGHDTTMSALSFAVYALARHPEQEARVVEEVARVCRGQEPSSKQLDQLSYTEAFVAETLRLWPPVAHIDRRAERQDVIGGFRIPQGASVALSPYVVQRRPDVWEEPLSFRPERFFGKPKSAYFPFSVGPRVCLGRALSLMEIKLFLAHLVPRFRFELPEGFQLALKSSMTVHPAGGHLPMRLLPR